MRREAKPIRSSTRLPAPSPFARGLLVAAAVAVAGCGEGGTATAEGPLLLVASGFTDRVLLIDPASGDSLGARALDPRPTERDEPHAVAVAPDGRHWYATLSHGEPTLWKYESDGDRLVGRVPLGTAGAGRIGISPDGRHAVIPDYHLGGLGATTSVAWVDLETLVVEEIRELCPAPHDAVWSPDGATVAFTCPLSDEVVLVDGATREVIRRTRIPGPGGETGEDGNPVVRPMNLVWTPDGETIWTTLMRTGELAVLNADGTGRARLRVGGAPAQLAITEDGGTIVVALRDDFAAAVVDVREMRVRDRIAAAGIAHPHGVALSPDGTTAFLSHEGTIRTPGGVSALDLGTGELLWSREAGSFNLGIAWRPEVGGE